MNKTVLANDAQALNNERVLQEMQDFLRALESYPARFALDPTVTFKQHCGSLIPAARAQSAGA